MIDLINAAETISKYLKVHTSPLSIKYYSNSKDLPTDVRRPNVFGVKMAFCQINTIARKWGWSFAVTPEDINCVAALMSFGWGDLGGVDVYGVFLGQAFVEFVLFWFQLTHQFQNQRRIYQRS